MDNEKIKLRPGKVMENENLAKSGKNLGGGERGVCTTPAGYGSAL